MENNNIENSKKKSPLKKLFIIIAIIGVIFILAGGTIFTVVLANNDWNISSLDNEQLTAAYFLDTEDRAFDSIEFRGNWRYVIRMGDEFRVDYYLSNVRDITISQHRNDNGNYTFVFHEGQQDWRQHISFGFNNINRREKTVYITLTQSVTAYFRGASSRITANGVDFDGFSLRGSSSRLDLQNSAINGSIALDGAAIRLNLQDSEISGNLTSSGSSVDVYMRDVEVGGNIIFEGASVDITAYNFSANRVQLSGSGRALNLTDSTVDEIISSGAAARFNFMRSQVRYISMTGSSARINAYNSSMHTLIVNGAAFQANLRLYGVRANVGQPRITGSAQRISIEGSNEAGVPFKTINISGSSARLNITMLGGESAFAP